MKQFFQVFDLINHFVGFYLSVVEDDDSVAHLAHFLHDMGGEDDAWLLAIRC